MLFTFLWLTNNYPALVARDWPGLLDGYDIAYLRSIARVMSQVALRALHALFVDRMAQSMHDLDSYGTLPATAYNRTGELPLLGMLCRVCFFHNR